MNDKEFLQWIHQRLQYKYGENPNVDFMIRLESIIAAKCKELDKSNCYVVLEDDRGWGTTVEAVYADKVEADKHAAPSNHLYVEEYVLHSHFDMGDI